jgi:hypothetical protein
MKRAWIIILASSAVYMALEPLAAANAKLAVMKWLGYFAIYGEPVTALIFISVWTWLGLHGPSKWWNTDIGTTLMVFAIAVFCRSAEVAWATAFTHGSISSPFQAWVYIGTLLLAMSMMLWRTWIWLYIHWLSGGQEPVTSPETPEAAEAAPTAEQD